MILEDPDLYPLAGMIQGSEHGRNKSFQKVNVKNAVQLKTLKHIISLNGQIIQKEELI